MKVFIVAIGIPCIINAWEGHREPSQTEQCSELLDYARELAIWYNVDFKIVIDIDTQFDHALDATMWQNR